MITAEPEMYVECELSLARAMETDRSLDVEADSLTAQGKAWRIRMIGELEIRGVKFALIGTLKISPLGPSRSWSRRRAVTDELTSLANRARL